MPKTPRFLTEDEIQALVRLALVPHIRKSPEGEIVIYKEFDRNRFARLVEQAVHALIV